MRAPKHKHHETLNFTGFGGTGHYAYYGPMSGHQGYGGFDYSGIVEYMNTSLFNHQEEGCSGYNSVADATGASALGWIYESGEFESMNLGETFSLKSMIAASAWSTNQEWTISTYTYGGGSFHLKGSRNFYLGQTAQPIKLGAVGRNIAAFAIVMDDLGSSGISCYYGWPTYGYQLAFGNLRIDWNGKIPAHQAGHHVPLPGEMVHAHHHVTPGPIHSTGAAHAPQAAHTGHAHEGVAETYHTQLLAFGHDPGGLTADFRLPQTEHFGV